MSIVRTLERHTGIERRPEEDATEYVGRLRDEGLLSKDICRRVQEQIRECRYGTRESLSDDLVERVAEVGPTDDGKAAKAAGVSAPKSVDSGDPSDSADASDSVNWRRLCLYLVACLPLAVVSLNLTARVPTAHMPTVETAHYYQALAFARDGLDSYFYVSLQESFSSIHLYSLLASPLVATGYTEGGRLISYLAAVLTAVGAGYTASALYDHKAGVLTVAFLFVNPYYLRFTWTITPEGLGIALTTLAVAAVLRYHESEYDRWFLLSLALLSLGIFNHLWEATIALPMTLVLLERRQLLRSGVVVVVVAVSVVGAKLTTRLQPQVVALSNYSVFDNPLTIFLTPQWWAATDLFRPFFVSHSLVLWLGLFFAGYWGLRRVSSSDVRFTVLFGWTAAGLAVPVLLPKGHVVHDYYLWGLVVPVSLSLGSHVVDVLLDGVENRSLNTESLVAALVVMLALSGTFVGAVYSVGIFEGTGYRYPDQPAWADDSTGNVRPGELAEAGRELRKYDVDASEVTFAGDWERTAPGLYCEAVRILVYGDVLADHFWIFGSLPPRTPPDVREAPSFVGRTVKSWYGNVRRAGRRPPSGALGAPPLGIPQYLNRNGE